MVAVRTCAVLAVAASLASAAPIPSEAELEEMWHRYRLLFRRSFHEEAEEASRFQAFSKNVVRAMALNEAQGSNCTDLFDKQSCVFGMTKFMDTFRDEFASTRLGYKPHHSREDAKVLAVGLEAVPTSVDWRTKGAVTKVKDQGSCGSCWAFSTTEEVESQAFMATGTLPVLSTQQIVACDTTDQGCNGGDTVTAYKYIQKVGGLDTAADYPDTSSSGGRTGTCKWDKKEVVKVTGFSYATPPCTSGTCKKQDEDAVAAALAAKGPVSICVNAGDWDLYSSGVYSASCAGGASDLDHCVQLVGYNKENSAKPYWIVRNSWNTDWGVDGYMYLEMGKNLCGVADEATIPQVSAADESVVV